MDICLITYDRLMAKAGFPFFNFNPRLKPGAKDPYHIRASAINLLFNRTPKIQILIILLFYNFK